MDLGPHPLDLAMVGILVGILILYWWLASKLVR